MPVTTNTRKLAALLGASGAGIATDGTLTSTAIGEVIVAGDIAAGAVGSSEIAAGAVTATEMAASLIGVKPHIIPDVLYPAVANVMLDGSTALSAVTTGPNSSTVTSSKYGTVQSDGRMYYYTDIKGSKPIKDPRIGAHFGIQRHKFRSLQLLEQETAAQGERCYSVDGREWLRVANGDPSTTISWDNDTSGILLDNTDENIEITGYFNDANILLRSIPAYDTFNVAINGTDLTANNLSVAANSPLTGRYVDPSSLSNISFSTTPTLGINTLKIGKNNNLIIFGIELIAQDTTSTATKSQIQIPSQNVVSYGKKFTVAETKHYNPFAFKTDGSTAWTSGNHNGTAWPIGTGSSTNIDTATSLGLAAWLHSSNYYYPYNGGRIVKWIASDGTIKTSVNMMPPNARSLLGGASSAKANASVANDTYLPTFEEATIDHSQAEVAKTFHIREFGNGGANGNASWADPSSVPTDGGDNIAFVMDDGLTAFSHHGGTNTVGGHGPAQGNGVYTSTNSTSLYVTFIGTGLSGGMDNTSDTTRRYKLDDVAQNLPYGTHILKLTRGSYPASTIHIDGVQVYSSSTPYTQIRELTFHQPKRPPIPEDAVVISDYMLMADTVQQATAAANYDGHISKGMLRKSLTRDFFYSADSGSSAPALSVSLALDSGFIMQNGSGAVMSIDLPHFGTKFTVHGENANTASSPNWGSAAYGGSAVGSVALIDNTGVGNAMDKFHGPTVAKELGLNILELAVSNGYGTRIVDMNTPTHTSSHYQTFETPFLYELVGGDRNMEQTNLVVTPDGKTWDEVIRDTSYIGKSSFRTHTDTNHTWATHVVFDDHRGGHGSEGYKLPMFNKDFAIAYNGMICLRDGEYVLKCDHPQNNDDQRTIVVNYGAGGGRISNTIMSNAVQDSSSVQESLLFLRRGDRVGVRGSWKGSLDPESGHFWAERIS